MDPETRRGRGKERTDGKATTDSPRWPPERREEAEEALESLVRQMSEDAARAVSAHQQSKVNFAGIVVAGWADRLTAALETPDA